MTYPSSGSDSGLPPWQSPPADPGYLQGGYGRPTPGYPVLAPGYPVAPGYRQPTGYHPGVYGQPTASGYPAFPGFGQPGGYPPPGAYPMGSGFPGGFPAGPGFPAMPPRQGLPKAAIFGGIGVLAVLVVVLGVVFWPSGGGLFSSDADQIKALMHTKIDPSDTAAMKAHHCAADGSLIDTFSKYGGTPPGSADPASRSGVKVEVGEPKISGDTATVDITASSGGYTVPVTQYFRKEGGEWKICMNDDSKMKALRNLPGMN